MSRIVGLNGHIAFSHYPKIEKICNVLFRQTSIQFFCYSQFFSDGGYTFLASHIDLGSYFFKEEAYPHTWLFNVPFRNFSNGLLLWDIARNFNSPEQSKIDEVIRQRIGLAHGIDVIEKFENYCDVYSFASSDRNIYCCSVNYIEQFILYFHQECQDMLQQARADKFYFPYIDSNITTPIINLSTKLDQSNKNLFDLKRFYLRGKYDGIYLTKKEVICLEQLSKGITAKQAAWVLGISYRTIEHHIENIKTKLGCTQLAETLLVVMQNNILT